MTRAMRWQVMEGTQDTAWRSVARRSRCATACCIEEGGIWMGCFPAAGGRDSPDKGEPMARARHNPLREKN